MRLRKTSYFFLICVFVFMSGCGSKYGDVIEANKKFVNAMEEYLAAWDLGKGWNFDQIAYIGDAENDLECMQKALYTGCPSDAVSIIKGESNYLCDAKGGYGAVYEFCMHILEKIKEQKNENNET